MNELIRALEVRVVDETGQQLGVMKTEQAVKLAKERGFDLIQVTEKVDPPVTRFGDYGKHLYQQEKKDRISKRQSQGGELKEARLTFNISAHDIETRARQSAKFLVKGDRVRISLRLRGRENALESHGREKMQQFLQAVRAITPVKIERELKKEPRGLSMVIAKS